MLLVVVVSVSAGMQCILGKCWRPQRHRLMSALRHKKLRPLVRTTRTYPIALEGRLAAVVRLGNYGPGRLAAQV